MQSASVPATGCGIRPSPCVPRLPKRSHHSRSTGIGARIISNAKKNSGDAPGSAAEDLGAGKAATPAAAGAPPGGSRGGPAAGAKGGKTAADDDQLLQPPSTVTGPAPAGAGIDVGGGTTDVGLQQGSAPEDATAEAAGGGFKAENLFKATGTASKSVSVGQRHTSTGGGLMLRAHACITTSTELPAQTLSGTCRHFCVHEMHSSGENAQ